MTKIRIFWDAQGPYQGGFVTDEWAGSPDCFFMADEGEVYVPNAMQDAINHWAKVRANVTGENPEYTWADLAEAESALARLAT